MIIICMQEKLHVQYVMAQLVSIQYFFGKPQCCQLNLKPQEYGEFDLFFLDLQKVQEIIRKHYQTVLL